jgi:hypothetical protein
MDSRQLYESFAGDVLHGWQTESTEVTTFVWHSRGAIWKPLRSESGFYQLRLETRGRKGFDSYDF